MPCYTRVKIIYNASTTEVNEWLAQQKNIKIIDIKFHDSDVCIIYERGLL